MHQTQKKSLISTPDEYSSPATPRNYVQTGHDFTLQTIMELQKSTGQLTTAVESLKESIDKQDKKVTKLEETVSGVTHKIYAATAVLVILVAIGGFIVNKAWDLMATNIINSAYIQQTYSQNISKKL